MTRDRFEMLLSLYADGQATAADRTELERAMRSDPLLRREFVERMHLEVGLMTLAQAAPEAKPAAEPRSRGRAGSPSRRFGIRPATRRPADSRRSTWLPFAAAAALFLGTVWILATRDQGPREAASRPPSDDRRAVLEEARGSLEEERAQAEAEQKKSEARLAALESEAAAMAPERSRDADPKAPPEARLRRLELEREAATAQLQEAKERERRAAAEVERMGKELASAPRRDEAPATRSQVAWVERVEGEVYLLGPAGRSPAARAAVLRPGEGLECVGAQSGALLGFPDRSRLELVGESTLREISEPPASGKRIVLEKGTVKAEVSRQAKDRPLVFSTPHGEARVLGTLLRLSVDPDPRKGTTLEVEEGRVELRNPAGRALLVDAGRQAVMAAGAPMASRPLSREEILLALDFEDGKTPALVETGTVEPGPARPGNRFCLAGASDATGASKIFIGGYPGLFTFQGDEVLSFDYWTDPQAAQVNFNLWNRTQKIAHEGQASRVVTGRWTRVSFRVADLGESGSRVREGDWVANLYVQSTGGSQRRFYIDNVVISRTRSFRPRPSEPRAK